MRERKRVRERRKKRKKKREGKKVRGEEEIEKKEMRYKRASEKGRDIKYFVSFRFVTLLLINLPMTVAFHPL